MILLFHSIIEYAKVFVKSQLPNANVVKILFFLMSARYFYKLNKTFCFLCFQCMDPKSTEMLYKEDFSTDWKYLNMLSKCSLHKFLPKNRYFHVYCLKCQFCLDVTTQWVSFPSKISARQHTVNINSHLSSWEKIRIQILIFCNKNI